MNILKRTDIKVNNLMEFIKILMDGYAVRHNNNRLSVVNFIHDNKMYVTNYLGTYKMMSKESEFFPSIPEKWEDIIVYEVEIENIDQEWYFKTTLNNVGFPIDLSCFVGGNIDFGKITLFSNGLPLLELSKDNIDEYITDVKWENIEFIKLN